MNRKLRPVQLSICFDPPQFPDLDSLIIHVIELKKAEGKKEMVMAMECDLSPTEFSMMKAGTRPWPSKAVPKIIRTTLPHGTKIVYWLMDMFLSPQDVRADRAADVLERYLADRPEADRAAQVIAEILKEQKGRK